MFVFIGVSEVLFQFALRDSEPEITWLNMCTQEIYGAGELKEGLLLLLLLLAE